ncbi:MAG: carbon-nitrogen hydrolase family protein, partial [Clostridia bacterium]|nr:carbon-nitrogen hydrolase family protein [Clostridia bacterium]
LVLCPVALEKEGGLPLQLSGVWREVEQNQFFAVESCFCGVFGGAEYYGDPIIHAPLEMTAKSDGLLARGDAQNDTATAVLDNEKRIKGIAVFDVLSQLNPELYQNMHLFGGGAK